MDQLLLGSASSDALSRQKSCNACVRSKRKCDKLAPVCSRCAERDEPCVYKRRRLAHQKPQAAHQLPEDHGLVPSLGDSELDSYNDAELQTSPPEANANAIIRPNDHTNSAAVLPPASFPFTAPSPFDFDFAGLSDTYLANRIPPAHTTATTNSDPQTRNDGEFTGHNSEDPFLNFSIDPSLDSSMWLALGQQGLEVERAGTPVNEEITATYEKMGDLCTPFDPWILYDPTSRSCYLHNRVKSFPSDFATQNATPFLHRHLYKGPFMPPCILACFSTSVMYTNRTEANQGMVLRALQQDVDKLVGGVNIAITPLEKLARVHALFLYQVIRLFDGDVALRAGAEKDLPVLEAWMEDLGRVRDNLGDGAGGSLGEEMETEDGDEVGDGAATVSGSVKRLGCLRDLPVPDSWERWIFAESVRRTILMVYSVIGMYQLMKKDPVSSGAPDDLGPWKYIYRWTLSRPLWEAEKSFDFYRAWEEKKPHFVIDNYALGEFLQHGRPELVDEFGKIILTA
ncbi:hypothetical protein V8F33_007672 [Rhypophila sp. PSN 637]